MVSKLGFVTLGMVVRFLEGNDVTFDIVVVSIF